MTDGETERDCEKSFCDESRQDSEESRHMFFRLFFLILVFVLCVNVSFVFCIAVVRIWFLLK